MIKAVASTCLLLILPYIGWAQANLMLKFSWTNNVNADYYLLFSTDDLSKPFSVYTNMGNVTEFTMVAPKNEEKRFFYVVAYEQKWLNVSLAWNTAPIDPAIVNYSLYYGSSSRAYTNSIYTGNVNQFIVSNLMINTPYFFGVTSINSNMSNFESDLSNEAYFLTPVYSTVYRKWAYMFETYRQ
jgi:hypothetical protein